MQPGPDSIITCPQCEGLARVFTLLSGNTFGAVQWTDGYHYAPMLPAPPPLTRCPRCQAFFWVEDAQVIGQINRPLPTGYAEVPEPRIEPLAWHRAPEIRKLSAHEYLEAIAAGAADTPQRERTLRILVWWRHNDAFRHEPQRGEGRKLTQAETEDDATASAQPPWALSIAAANNLARLIEILDVTQDEDRVIQAEALRELGLFDQAEALLTQPFPEGFRTAVQFILDLTRRRIRVLRELPESK